MGNRLILRALLILAALIAFTDFAQAQCSGQPSANQVCAGPSSGGSGLPGWRALIGADIPAVSPPPITVNSTAITGGTAGRTPYNNAGTYGEFVMGGDCTLAVPSITCTKTGGAAFSAAATTNTGTSGATIPLNNGGFTQSGAVAFSGGSNFTGGIQLNGNAVSANGGLTSTIASGTAALNTAAIASGACATVVTVTAANVLTTDIILAGFNGDPTGVTGYSPATTGVLIIYPYPTAGNVNFKVCNSTATSITPAALTLNWRVAR